MPKIKLTEPEDKRMYLNQDVSLITGIHDSGKPYCVMVQLSESIINKGLDIVVPEEDFWLRKINGGKR